MHRLGAGFDFSQGTFGVGDAYSHHYDPSRPSENLCHPPFQFRSGGIFLDKIKQVCCVIDFLGIKMQHFSLRRIE